MTARFVFATFWFAGAVAAQRPDSITSRVDSLLAPWNKPGSPGCMIGASVNGATVYLGGAGIANLDHRVAIGPDTRFMVASVSKQFTAMAVLLLARDGRLSIDDDIRKYVPELPDYGERITLRHLLTHTSGIPAADLALLGWRGADRITNEDIVAGLTRYRIPQFAPGARFRYSNPGFILLTAVVERVTRMSLRAFTDSAIFVPLGMTHTRFDLPPPRYAVQRAVVEDRALGYRPFDADWLEVAISDRTYGHSNLYTTAADLLKWEQNFADARVGGPDLIGVMQAPTILTGSDTSFWGMGLTLGRHRGSRTIGHGGTHGGYQASVQRFPDHGFAVVALCNLTDVDAYKLAIGAANIFLEPVLPPRRATAATPAVPVPVPPTADQVAAVVGLYHESSSGELRRIFVRDGKLQAIASGRTPIGAGAVMTPLGPRRFSLFDGVDTMEFTPSASGRPRGLRESLPGRPLLVFQLEPASTPSSAERRAYAGLYESPDLKMIYRLVERDSSLVLELGRRPAVVLQPVFADAFVGDGMPVRLIRFLRNAQGAVTGFALTGGSVSNLRFDRIR